MKRLVLSSALALCASLLLASQAFGAFGLKDLDVSFENENGTPTLQAGAHPYAMTTSLSVNTELTPKEELVPEGEIKDLDIAQIPGFIGSQTAVPTCDTADFNNRFEGRPNCPDATAVGYAAVEAEYETIKPADSGTFFHVAVYNLTPPPGVPARLGFIVLNVPPR